MNRDPKHMPGNPSDVYLVRKSLESLSHEELLDYAIGLALTVSATKQSLGNTPEAMTIACYAGDSDAREVLRKTAILSEKLTEVLESTKKDINSSN